MYLRIHERKDNDYCHACSLDLSVGLVIVALALKEDACVPWNTTSRKRLSNLSVMGDHQSDSQRGVIKAIQTVFYVSADFQDPYAARGWHHAGKGDRSIYCSTQTLPLAVDESLGTDKKCPRNAKSSLQRASNREVIAISGRACVDNTDINRT